MIQISYKIKYMAPYFSFTALPKYVLAIPSSLSSNCLFGALADQMDGSRATHLKHRQQIVAYMRQNRLHFEPFVEDDVSFHDHS